MTTTLKMTQEYQRLICLGHDDNSAREMANMVAKTFILTNNPRKRPREEEAEADISATMVELQGQFEGKVKEVEEAQSEKRELKTRVVELESEAGAGGEVRERLRTTLAELEDLKVKHKEEMDLMDLSGIIGDELNISGSADKDRETTTTTINKDIMVGGGEERGEDIGQYQLDMVGENNNVDLLESIMQQVAAAGEKLG